MIVILLLFFLSVVIHGQEILQFDPNIEGDNILINIPLNMTIKSINKANTGIVVNGQIIYGDPPIESEAIQFKINIPRRIIFKYGYVGSTKIVIDVDDVPAGFEAPPPMTFSLYTTLSFQGFSNYLLIGSYNFIFIKAEIIPNIVNSTGLFLLCDVMGNQQYQIVQEWINIPLNTNYEIFVDKIAVSDGQVCQLVTGVRCNYATDALALAKMAYVASPFGGNLTQLEMTQASILAKKAFIQNIIQLTSDSYRDDGGAA